MKILLTGGGTGGHFYPIIAVTEALHDLVREKRLLPPELIYASDSQFDQKLLEQKGLIFKKIYAGKLRRYFSLLNVIDILKTGVGILKALWMIYSNMPDVIFGKGGYASFPVLLAGRLFRIPVIIHDSDTIPGKVNSWAGKFAERIAISFPETLEHFPKERIALTGVPIRKSILGHTPEEAREVFEIETDLPTIFILGGSQGAQKINDVILESLSSLVKNYNVIHQCGKQNEEETRGRSKVILENSIFKKRYHLYPFLNDALMRNASSVATLVISRAGGEAIYEIATWGLPSIIIPIKNSAQNHQRENAYSYKRTGSAEITEENNLTSHVLQSEIKRIITSDETRQKMKESTKAFAKPDAAKKIAQEILNLALKHAQ